MNKTTAFLLLSVLSLSVFAMPAQAATTVNTAGTGSGGMCAPQKEIVAVGSILAAGFINICVYYDPMEPKNTGIQNIGYVATGPGVIGLNTVAFTPTFISTTGCTASSWTALSDSNLAGTGGTGFATLTLTTRDCRTILAIDVISSNPALSTFARYRFPINIHVPESYQLNYQCAATGDTPESFDVSTDSCTAPTTNLSGTISVAQSGSWTISDDANGWAVHQDPLSGGLLITNGGGQTVRICGQTGTCGPLDVNSTSQVSIGNATQNVNVGPGFWELFGPTIFAILFIAILARIAIWMVPGGVAFGLMVAIMAFQQPFVIIVLLQACAGFILTGAALWWLRARQDEFKSKRQPRRFFE